MFMFDFVDTWQKEYEYHVDYATNDEFGYIDDYWDTVNDWDEGQDYIHITHYMPIPEPIKS